MITREVVASYVPPREILLASPPNRTAMAIFAILSAVNYIISIPAFLNGRWESYLSFILANICAAAAVLSYYARNELIILTRERAIRLRNGVGPLRFERLIPFEQVRGVRLTLARSGKPADCSIEVLCNDREIEVPSTAIPRQEALFLAVLMGVQLIKINNENSAYRHTNRLNLN